MEGKMPWFPSVTTVDLTMCDEVADISSNLVELRSLPSLHTLMLPASCTARAVDAEAVYGLTALKALEIWELRETDLYDRTGELMRPLGEWVLDLSRLTTTLISLSFLCRSPFDESGKWHWTHDTWHTVTNEQVLELSDLTGLTELNLNGCAGVTTEGLVAVSGLTALSSLSISSCDVTDEVLRAVSTALTILDISGCRRVTFEGLRTLRNLTALTTLDISGCHDVKDEGLRAVSGALTALTTLDISSCHSVTSEGLRAVSSLTALTSLRMTYCKTVTDEVLRAVSTALTALTSLDISGCKNLTNESLRTLSSFIALVELELGDCDKVTAAGKQALRTALPNLTIMDTPWWNQPI